MLITIAALNMVISLYYYLRIVKVMFMEKNETPMEKLQISLFPRISLLTCMAGIILIGFTTLLYDYIFSLSTSF